MNLFDLKLEHFISNCSTTLKNTLFGLRQFLATKSPLKMMKNTFYFNLKALFALKIFKFLSWFFGHVEEQFDLKDKVIFKIYKVITCHSLIPQELKATECGQTTEFGQLIEYGKRNIFLQ